MKTLLQLSFFLLVATLANGQSLVTVVDSLRLPTGLEYSGGKLWLVETGYGFNDGAVSLVQNGSAIPAVVGLPSFFDTTTQETVGPWHVLALPSNKIAVTVGAIGQVLIFDLSGFQPGVSPPKTMGDAITALDIYSFSLGQGSAESNPYSVARDASGNLYVADAAANAIVKVTAAGQMSVFASFPSFPNPLPFGPPMVDAVPTRIIAKPGGGFYVGTLTGFPFLDGAATVYSLDAAGNVTPYAIGLTCITDLALDANTGDLYALQFGHFDLMGMPPGFAPNSAKVTRIKPDGSRETVLDNFGPSAGLVLDGQGDLYVTELGQGDLKKMENVATGLLEQPLAVDALVAFPNPAVGATRIEFELKKAAETQLRVFSANGQQVFAQNLGWLEAGKQAVVLQAGNWPASLYTVELATSAGLVSLKLMVD